MPRSSPRLCPRCRRPTRGRCTTCLPAQRATTDRHRGSAASRGYGHHWREHIRKPYLRDHPLCVLCGALANVPDHWPETRKALIARKVRDPDDDRFLRALCDACHNTHGARD